MVKWNNWLNRKIGQMEKLVEYKNQLNGKIVKWKNCLHGKIS